MALITKLGDTWVTRLQHTLSGRWSPDHPCPGNPCFMKRPPASKRGEHVSLLISPISLFIISSWTLQWLLIRSWAVTSLTACSWRKERIRLLSSWEKGASEFFVQKMVSGYWWQMTEGPFCCLQSGAINPRKKHLRFFLLTQETFWFLLEATLKELSLLNAFCVEFEVLPKVLEFTPRISSTNCSKCQVAGVLMRVAQGGCCKGSHITGSRTTRRFHISSTWLCSSQQHCLKFLGEAHHFL